MFGICVNNCDCTNVKKNVTKNYTLCKGQLVNIHSHKTDNVELSLYGADRTKLTSPNHLYFDVIDDKLFACLNAIISFDERIKFYNNKENRDFVLNLNGPTTVSVTVLNQQLKGLFQEQTNVKGKTFFTVELLEIPSKQLISDIKKNCQKFIVGKYQLTVAANMIQKLNLPDVTIDEKIEESFDFEQDKKRMWCCSICNQENWFKSKKCRKCDSAKSDVASFPGEDNYLSDKYHPQGHTDHSVAIEAFPPSKSYDTSIVDCYNTKSTGKIKNDKSQTKNLPTVPPVNRSRNQNQCNDNVNGVLSGTEKASKPETVQYNIQKSREHKIDQLCQILGQIYKDIMAEKRRNWTCQICWYENIQLKCENCDEPYQDELRPSHATPWTCTLCLTAYNIGNNCSTCNEKHDEFPLYTTPRPVRIDKNVKVEINENSDDISDPYQIDKNNFQAVVNKEKSDLLEYYMITVLPNTIKAKCMSCCKPLDISKGFVLTLCNHTFCDTCIKAPITKYCQDNQFEQLKCRARIDKKMCDRIFELSEIKYFLPDESYEKFKKQLIDANETNSFIKMCYDKNCSGYFLCEKYYKPSQVEFVCGKCKLKNCLECTAIHDGLNCSQYGKLIDDGKSINKEAIDMFLNWVREGIAIPCPECNALIEKDEGCDWVQCSFCQTETSLADYYLNVKSPLQSYKEPSVAIKDFPPNESYDINFVDYHKQSNQLQVIKKSNQHGKIQSCDVNLTDYDQFQCDMGHAKDYTSSSRTSYNIPSTILRKLASIKVCGDSSESRLFGMTSASSNESGVTSQLVNRSESIKSDSEIEIKNTSQKQRIDNSSLSSFEENFLSTSSRNYAIPLDSNLIVQNSHHSVIDDSNDDHFMIAVVRNTIKADCLSCHEPLDIAKGFILPICKHVFCEPCIKFRITTYIIDYELDKLTCRARINNRLCDRRFELCEIKYFLSDQIYQQFNVRLIRAKVTNSFIKMCCDKNCSGYYLCEKYYQTPLVEFVCGKCNLKNCLQCTAIHEGLNCLQYGKLIGDGSIDKETVDMFLTWIRDGIAMPCPECNTLIEKDEECDWVQCPICQTEICWATRGRRWGPGGSGDTSGGCGCTREKKCVETCNYCH